MFFPHESRFKEKEESCTVYICLVQYSMKWQPVHNPNILINDPLHANIPP